MPEATPSRSFANTVPSDGDPGRTTANPYASGALLGLAVGDALGTTLEFTPRDSHPLQTEMVGGGPFDLEPGVWTDDTAMALALADSLVACGSLDPTDLMQRFCAWWREGRYSPTGTCFDIGMTTREALAHFERTGEPFAGSTDPMSAGNGSIMRLAPVALAGSKTAEEFAAMQSRTTHGAPEAVDGARLLARLLSRLVWRKDDALLGINDLVDSGFRGEVAIEALGRGDYRTKTRDAIRSSGYVVHTLEATLWAVATTKSFEEALVLAVNLGDDADTVGAVTGQIAGALYGRDAIPQRWLAHLAWRDEIDAYAKAVAALNEE